MSERVIVTVKEGKIRGLKKKSEYSGIEYYSFLGVPYGQSTAGNARFKDPVKVKPWNTLLDATTEKIGCIQLSPRHQRIAGTEDCLFNNIHTPQLPSNDVPLKAVIFYIHPGSFCHGSPDPSYYGSPEYFINRDVVCVSVAFRLHILGHLNLGLQECSGNQSLKDIALSLEWVRENISSFGGDPNNITLLGSSSGAITIHLLMLSPLARGLYHKAVIMGLYAFSPVILNKHENISIAYELACQLGYKGGLDDKKKLLKFYKKLPISLAILKEPQFYSKQGILPVFQASPFLPTIEFGEIFPGTRTQLISSTNRIPLLIGFCEKEAALALPQLRSRNRDFLSKYFRNVVHYNAIGWGTNLNDNELDSIYEQIKSFYLGAKSIESASQSLQCDILTDAALSDVYASLINVIAADLPSSVFVYKFQFDGDLSVLKLNFKTSFKETFNGTFHAADGCYLFESTQFIRKTINDISDKDHKMIETFSNIVTTFAKAGDPNHEGLGVYWKPSTPQQPCYLSINNTLEMRDELLNGQRTEFWHNIVKQFGKHAETFEMK